MNSEVTLNRTEGAIDQLNIKGGTVSIADRGNLQVNGIHVESLQDTASSSNSSKGGSIGGGYGGGSKNITASYNQGKGNSDSAWVNETSKLLIGNAQNDADLDAMGVKKVTNIGGVIANATKNTDGTLTDHGKLNYSGELELKDIEDHNYNSSSGFNVSTTIGIPQKGTQEASTAPKGSTTVGVNRSGQETEQLTKATMGQGTVTNATDSTNRDINNTQEITRDQTTGMLDGSVTVDHRLLKEDGWMEIIQEQKDLPENLRQATKNLKNDVEKLVLKLPDSKIQNQILISINQMVGGDLIVDAYKDFLSNGGTKEEFFVVANNEYAQFYIQQLAEVNKKVKELEAQGYSLEQILNTSMGTTGNTNIISLNGQNEVNLTADSTIGMELLTASYGLSKNYSDFQQETNKKYGVAIDPETLSLVLGTILTGPAKTVANVLISSQYGEYIETVKEKGIDLLATGITAASYGTSSETISIYTDPALRETITTESQLTQDWSQNVSESKEGAKFLIDIIAGIVVGGSAKGQSNTTKIDGKDVEVSTAGVGSDRNTLEIGWVDKYSTQKKVTGDGTIDRDHQPSKAALLKRAAELKESPLTQYEKNKILNEGISVTVPKEVHASGPTYKGKNSKELIEKDARDLQSAQLRDSNAMRLCCINLAWKAYSAI